MSTKVFVDADEEFCLVRFDIPDRPNVVKGVVRLSSHNEVAPGTKVLAAGPSVKFIADKIEAGFTLFKVALIPNSQKRTPNDPDWYANYVALPAENKTTEVIGRIEEGRAKLKLALDQLSLMV